MSLLKTDKAQLVKAHFLYAKSVYLVTFRTLFTDLFHLVTEFAMNH